MKLTGLELIEIRLPLREPFVSHYGARTERRFLLLRVEGEEGRDGWGECVAGEDPSYSYETTDTAWHILTTFLLPYLAGHEIQGPEDLWTAGPPIQGHPMAKATVEMAVWDLQAREIGLPLWELIGGTGTALPVGAVVGLQSTEDALLAAVEGFLNRGYARIKLKIAPGRDIEVVRAVRRRFTEAVISVDANGAYRLEDSARLKELDAFGLSMIEQPLGRHELIEHARLADLLETPICLDESIRSEREARAALDLHSCEVITVKPGPAGGLAGARAIHDVCRERGVPAWCGGMLESGVGRAHLLALASLPGFTLPGDVSESRRYWEQDIVNPEFVLRDGRLKPPDGPGIGVEPDADRIGLLAVRRASFGNLRRPVAREPA